MQLTKYNYTAGHVGIRKDKFRRWDIRPDFQSGKSDEARTYQSTKMVSMPICPDGKGASNYLRFALIPPLKHVGFTSHEVKFLSQLSSHSLKKSFSKLATSPSHVSASDACTRFLHALISMFPW